jgi:hypothetical protein
MLAMVTIVAAQAQKKGPEQRGYRDKMMAEKLTF